MMKHYTLKWLMMTALMLMCASGAWAASGDVIFSETFDSEEALNNWTIVNSNGGRTWEYLNGTAAYMLDYESGLPGDDWLISSEFTLDVDKVYELKFYMGVASATENLRVLLGTSTDISSFETVLIDLPGVVGSDSGDKVVKIVPPADGTYRLAFYAYSEPWQHRVEVDNIYITEKMSTAAPGMVTELSVTAGEAGALTATVTGVAPAVTAGGTELSQLTSIIISRDGEQVAVLTDVQPGSTFTFTDENAVHGYNTYSVVATNSAGNSDAVEVQLWVGPDNPTAPLNVVAVLNDQDNSVTVTWDAPTGSQHGGYVNYGEITYTISRNGEIIATGLTETTYIDKTPVERGQSAVTYTVTPYYQDMEGASATSAALLAGAPVTLPYHDSFAGQVMTYTWVQDANVNAFEWSLIGDDDEDYEYEGVATQDSDDGMFYAPTMYADYGDQSRFVSPMFSPEGVNTPVMTFWFYYSRSSWYDPEYEGEINDRMQVQISYDGGEWQDVENAVFYCNDNNNGWTQCQVYLPMTSCKYFQVGLLATAESDSYPNNSIYVDNITIDESAYTNDLAVAAFTVDNKRVTAGKDFNFTINVKNRGSEDAQSYKVEVYCGTTVVATFDGTSLAAGESATFNYTYTTTPADALADSLLWHVYVAYTPDENLSNNTSEVITTSVRESNLPAPCNLAGEATDDHTVALNWDACTSMPATDNGEGETVTDDFESYDAFIIDGIGEWTVYDGDKANTLASPRIPVQYDNEGAPMAFQVFNNILSCTWVEDNYDDAFEAHSGNQYLICPCTEWPAENDDWLITPRLDGTAQTVSFYAHAASYDSEWFQVLYSTTDTHHDSFIAMNDGETFYAHEGWQQYSFDVPAGTRYVAVRCIRRSVMLFIDDFTYRAYNGSTDGYTLVGYNVYRNGEKVNDEPIPTNAYTDTNLEFVDGLVYTVTAVYVEGESGYSNEVLITHDTGIQGVNSDSNAAVIGIYSVDGKVLSTPQQGINILRMSDGTVRKVLVK